MATQALISSSSIASSTEAARQILGGRPFQSPIKKASFVVRATASPPVKQGANRPLWFASKQSLSYLDGSLPGDYGFDPLGLSDPEGTGGFIEPKWLAYGEVINGRFAMLGVVGAIAPEILGKAGLIPAETALPWFQTGVIPPAGTYNYWADGYTLFVLEMALMGFAEHRRFQDWAKPGSMGKQYFLGLEKGLGGSGDPAYPGGPFFNPLGFGTIGYEVFMVLLNYLYTGKIKSSPSEVSSCVDNACAHDACRPAINYAVELMYASSTFQIKELVMVVERYLDNFVDKATPEDVIPILLVAFHCKSNQLLEHCIQRVARSDLDNATLEKELPHEVLTDIKSRRLKSRQGTEQESLEEDSLSEKRIRRILKALESDDIELLTLLLEESNVTLNDACALHYAAAYCNSKVVNEVLELGLGADVNLQNSRGYNVLHVAARRKEPSIIMGLLAKGASVLDTTRDGHTALSICRRLTRLKDYNDPPEQGKVTNKDRLCIDVLEREMIRNPMIGSMSSSSLVLADELLMRLLLFENRVALARMLFPQEAMLAMEIAHADSTAEFTGLSATNGLCRNPRGVDLNKLPSEQVKRLQERLVALLRTVETGRRFFPNCSEVLDRLLEDDKLDSLMLESGTPEEQRSKKMRYTELKDEVMEAFKKDKAEKNWAGFSTSSSSSCSPKTNVSHKFRKK